MVDWKRIIISVNNLKRLLGEGNYYLPSATIKGDVMKNFNQNLQKRKIIVITAMAVFVAVVSGFGVYQAKVSAASVQDCTTNSIIQCGAQNSSEFITKVKANNPADLQTIYTDFRFPTAHYDAFASSAKNGMAYTDGTVKVDGKTVITDAWSLGRTKFSYSTPYVIANHTYYRSAHTDVLKSNLPVMVYFDANGNAAFAVLNACGNPVGGKIVKQTTPPPAPAPAPKPTPSPTPTPPAPTPTPVTPVKTTAAMICTGLQATVNPANNLEYIFTATTSSTNATLKSADFIYGDGMTSPNVPPTTATPTTVTITHDYAKAGTYNVRATVHFVNSDTTQTQTPLNAVCPATTVTIAAAVVATVTPPAPVVPVAAAPTALPKTGAGIAGMFGGASVLGTIGYHMRLRRKTVKADQLVDSLLRS